MRVKQKSKEKPIESKQPLPLTEYKYETGLKKNRRQKIAIEIDQSHPLKILAHKLSVGSESIIPKSKASHQQQQEQEARARKEEAFRKMITPRDVIFQPRRSVFNRYNYETYNNYEYKNPFKPRRFPYEDKMEQPLKNNPGKGSQKNLQIVFCEHKYKDFVQKSNSKFRQFIQTSRDFPTVNPGSPKSKSKSKFQRYGSQSKIYSSTWYSSPSPNPNLNLNNTRKKKTTLSAYLQQFTTLEKLSEYMQRQHKLNQKYLLQGAGDVSRTVLLDIVIHRFDFLKQMKKRTRDSILRILFGQQSMHPLFKINIQDYIKLIQLLISRDAEPILSATFIYKFLFKEEEEEVRLEDALMVLEGVGGSARRHGLVEARLGEIVGRAGGDGRAVYERIKGDQGFRGLLLDLITGL